MRERCDARIGPARRCAAPSFVVTDILDGWLETGVEVFLSSCACEKSVSSVSDCSTSVLQPLFCPSGSLRRSEQTRPDLWPPLELIDMGRYALSISLFAILACTASAVVTTWKTTEEICDAYGSRVCTALTADDSGAYTVHYQPKDACEALDGCASYSTSTCTSNAPYATTWNSLSSHFGDVAGANTVHNDCRSKTTEATCPSGTCFWDGTQCEGSLDSWVAHGTSANAPEAMMSYIKASFTASQTCSPLKTSSTCNANKACYWLKLSSAPSGSCYLTGEAAIGFFASPCPTEAGYGASLMNITLAEAQAIVGVSQAGDVTRGALLFAAFAALLVLGV